MNLSNQLGISGKGKSEAREAQLFFKNKYPDIIYNESTDSYVYRGYKFNYFKAGIGIGIGVERRNSYLLVDNENSSLWLFDYGPPEEMWQKYLGYKKDERVTVSVLNRLLNCFS